MNEVEGFIIGVYLGVAVSIIIQELSKGDSDEN